MDWISTFTQFGNSALSKVKRQSALDPVLYFSICVMILSMIGMAAIPEFGFLFSFLMTGGLIFFALAFLLIFFLQPDKLRSESYELRKMALEVIEQKGGRVPIAPASIQEVANTYLPNNPEVPDDD